MVSDLIKFYRTQVILSASLFVVIFSQVWGTDILTAILILLGCLLGTFFLDLDYFIYAYFLNPDDFFSHKIKDFVKSKDFAGALNYTIHHSNDIKNKTLNSAFFQVMLSVFTLYFVRSWVSHFLKALVISILLNSIYRFVYFYLQKEHHDWFWSLKKTPPAPVILIFNLGLLVVIGISILLYR